MIRSLFAILILCCSMFSLTGCASLVVASLKGKLPITNADHIKVSVNVAVMGGGSIEVNNVHTNPDGSVVAGQYLESIQTGGGSVQIEGTNVQLKKLP